MREQLRDAWRRPRGWVELGLLAAAAVLAIGMFVPGVVVGQSWSNGAPDILMAPPMLVAYLLGAYVGGVWSVVGLVLIVLAFSTGDISGDQVTMFMFSVPPWGIGKVIRSRVRLSAELEARARELEGEREAFMLESVRYERARIARDLHDVVAHNLSMIVVQAGASRRALDADPGIAAESLRNIESGAQRAELEIGQLVELLGEGGQARGRVDGLHRLDRLVAHAAKAGLSVTYSVAGSLDTVEPELAEVVYHLAQEGITNALKHAPGAAIAIVVAGDGEGVSVMVENGVSPVGLARPALPDGGFGLAGLRDRLSAVGGSLRAGATASGGWRLEAEIPVA